MEKKFNKANVSEMILNDIHFLQRNFCFDKNNGTAQLKGKDENTIIHYGKFIALIRLHEELFGDDKKYYL